MSDLMFQDLSTVQNNLQQKPVTIPSAATITPKSFLTILSGTTPVSTISPPTTGCCMLAFLWTTGTVGAFTSVGGNIGVTVTTVTNRPMLMIWNPLTGLWYPVGA